MQIDYLSAIGGGLLIGVAVTLMLLLLGRITGISGIFWQALSQPRQLLAPANAWRGLFLLGIILGPLVMHYLFNKPVPAPNDAGPLVAGLAGLVVGFGTRLGSGCTSGHGICGISRLSPRSIFATLTFMGAGFLTVYLIRHVLQLS